MSRSAHSLSFCCCLCCAVTFLFSPPPLLFCYIFSSIYPHYSLVPHCPSLCSVSSHFCVPCCVTVLSEYPQHNCVWLQSHVNSAVNELQLQAGALCKCLCSGEQGQFVMTTAAGKLTRWQWQAAQYICSWNACFVPFHWNQPLNTVILSDLLKCLYVKSGYKLHSLISSNTCCFFSLTSTIDVSWRQNLCIFRVLT